MNIERFLQEFQEFCEKHLGKVNTLTAHELFRKEDVLISFLLSAYNCYQIKQYSKRNEYSMITNPNELWHFVKKEEQIICIEQVKMMIEDRVKNYDCRNKTTDKEIKNG